MQQRQEALHPINARSLRAETYRDILVASPPSAELREACPVEPECRAARGGHAAGEIVRHVTDAATIRISAAAGRDRRGSRGSGGPGADRERDLTVARLEQPKEQWKTLRTTNTIERLHEEFRRRVKAQSSLPTEDSAVVLLFSLVASGQIRLRRVDGWQKIHRAQPEHVGRSMITNGLEGDDPRCGSAVVEVIWTMRSAAGERPPSNERGHP